MYGTMNIKCMMKSYKHGKLYLSNIDGSFRSEILLVTLKLDIKNNSLSHSCGMLFGLVECVYVATTVIHQPKHVLTMLLAVVMLSQKWDLI
jgi:hypothetical protein